MPYHENESIVLVGLPGSGKSRIGALLADRLGWVWADTDSLIEHQAGLTVAELVAAQGWPNFRRLEQQAMIGQLRRCRVVIATGGGIVESPDNRAAMKSAGLTVWLQASFPVLLERLARDSAERPLLNESPAERLAELAERREPLYADVADYRIDTDGLDESAVADMIAAIVREKQEQAR